MRWLEGRRGRSSVRSRYRPCSSRRSKYLAETPPIGWILQKLSLLAGFCRNSSYWLDSAESPPIGWTLHLIGPIEFSTFSKYLVIKSRKIYLSHLNLWPSIHLFQ